MFHNVVIVGNLGRDPEMKFLEDGRAVTTFSVAAKDGRDGSIWFRVSVFGNQAESCNTYLKKGGLVAVEGRLQADKNGGPRVWTDKDGAARSSFEVVATNVRFGPQKRDDAQPAEDIPF